MTHRGFAAFVFLLAGACASGAGAAPARVDEFVNLVGQVQVEAELARVRSGEATMQLHTLVGADYGTEGVIANYARFVQAVDAAEQQAAFFAQAVQSMHGAGDEVFASWERDVATIAGDRMRERSQARMTLARERFHAVLAAVEPTLLDYVRVNRSMRDIAVFLAHDLNTAALTAIQDDVRQVDAAAEQLDAGCLASLQAARAYVDATSLPAAPPAAPSPEPKPAPTPTPMSAPTPAPAPGGRNR